MHIVEKSQDSQDKTCCIKRTYLKKCRFWYLDVSVIFSDPRQSLNADISVKVLKMQIIKSLKQLFGEAGAATDVDIMKYNPTLKRAILRCPADCYVKLRSSLTLTSECGEYKCLFKINKASANLLSLSANSRTFQH